MDTDDDDVNMVDVPGTSSARSFVPAPEDFRPVPVPRHSIPSTFSPRSTIPNGFQDSQTLSRIPYVEERIISTNVNGQSSREASVLAHTASNLSIDQARPNQTEVDSYLEELELEETDPPQPFMSELPTGFCYDVRMRYHAELAPPENRRDYHPEDPRRIFSIYRELCVAGLIYDQQLTKGALVSKPLRQIDVREVDESEVELVHDKKHWDLMKATEVATADDLIMHGGSLDSVYLSGSTFRAALLSAGGAIETTRAVVHGLVKNAMAIIRPPGHHAECNRAMGFCIFDNVSIATKVCQIDYAETCKKVLILDWDVHHGNGIQQAFYQDPNVLYISIHVHEGGNFYPSGPYGDHTHIGAGPGLGRNINIPWPTKGMGDADYIFAFHQIVMPAAYEFNPDLIMIAAGFDAAEGDQLGGCFVSPACYAHMTHMLKSLAGGKVVACLEGGYNLRSIARSALAVTRTLNGEVPPRMLDRKPTESAVSTVLTVKRTLTEYYDCFWPKDSLNGLSAASHTNGASSISNSHTLGQASQAYFATTMRRYHKMIPVPIRDSESKLMLDDHVFVTKNHNEKVPLLVLMHDPHDAMAISDPMSGRLDMNESRIANGASRYRDAAIISGWAVIDVTVPEYPAASPEAKVFNAATLAERMWDQHVEYGDHVHVFFLGIGNAFRGQMWLLNSKETFWDIVSGTIAIIPSLSSSESTSSGGTGVPVLAAKPINDDDSPKVYHRNSLNFVGKWHSFWDGKKEKKRRYGAVVKSEETGVQQMLDVHAEDILGWIAEKCGGSMDV